MFFDTFRHIYRTASRDGGFVLWMEPDMVPLRPNWLKDLESEWNAGHYTVMGALVHRGEPREHINGGACYAKDYVRVVPPIGIVWDMCCYPYIRNFGVPRATNLFDFRYKCETLATPPDPAAAILHGVKDGSVYDYVERMWGR